MKRILLIEDHLEIRENVSEILTLENFIVFAACNGKAGVKIAKKETPDLILCDITMPGMDGYEVFNKIKKHSSTSEIPFIFITAKSTAIDICKGLDLGAEDYIIKPFDESELLSSIRNKIKQSEHLKRQLNEERLNYVKELENIIQIISHKVRGPLCTSIGLASLLDTNNYSNVSNKDLKKIIDGIRVNTSDLNDFTKELSHLMYQSIVKHKKNI